MSGLTFRSLIHFEFIFVYGVRECSKFTLLHVPVQWHICTMEYNSAIKRNEIELFVVRWMELESVIQSEISQKEKNKYRMLTHVYGI